MMTVNTACRACDSTKLIKVIDLGAQPLANAFLKSEQLNLPEPKYPLEVYFCEDCNLAQLIHVVDKSVLFEDYIYFSSGMPKLSDHFLKYAEDVINRFLRAPNDLVVEMGSNDGILLQFFKNNGFKVLGVDPAKNIAQVARARGIETVADFFSLALAREIVRNRGKAKVIMGNNVVAHINDYQDLCAGVKELLNPDGVFVFEAPYLVDMFENLSFDTIYHEHLNFLAIRPLQRLFQKFGLEIFDVKIVPAQGKSIRVFVGNVGQHKIEESVEECVKKEEALGLDRKESYFKLAREIRGCRERVLNFVLEFKRIGKSLAAYGAPAKGNTLLNYYGIDANILDFALDELHSKQNRYTPGTHVPVVPKQYADENRPDYYLLLAWNYLSVILEKEKNFLEAGGAFILPTGKIVSKKNQLKQILPKGKKKILICGGYGFIGSNFVRHLYDKYEDYELFNLDLLTYSGNRQNLLDIREKEFEKKGNERRYHFYHGNICDRVFLENLFKENKFDIVVNFAAESHVDRSLCSSYDFIRTNVVGTHVLIEECRKHNVPRFLQISTDEVYGDIADGHSTEEALLNPSNPYSASKASADIIVKSYIRSHKLPALIIRGSNNFGPYQYPEKLIPLAISNLIEEKKIPVHGDGKHIRSWIYVLDFCQAIDRVMHSGESGHIYNANGTLKSNLEILEIIRNILGLNKELSEYIEHTDDRPGADLRYAPDSTKLRQTLDWAHQHDFDEAMRNTVKWYVENPTWWQEIKNKNEFTDHYDRQQRAAYY